MEPIESQGSIPDAAPSGAPRPASLREVPWRWRDALIGLGPLALARAASALVAPASLAAAPRWLWLPLTVLALAWMLTFPLGLATRRYAAELSPPRPRAIPKEVAFALVELPIVLVGLSLTITALVSLSGGAARPTAPLAPLARSPARLEAWALLALAVAVAPVAEEVLFRGLLYNALRRRIGRPLAALVQAAVFGVLHPFPLADAVAVALVGVALAACYEWRRTLLAPVLVHAGLNAVSMAVLIGGGSSAGDPPVLGVYGEAHGSGCLITGVVAGSVAEEAGLRAGDMVAEVDGEPVRDLGELSRAIRAKRVGQRVELAYLRGGSEYRVDAVLKGRAR